MWIWQRDPLHCYNFVSPLLLEDREQLLPSCRPVLELLRYNHMAPANPSDLHDQAPPRLICPRHAGGGGLQPHPSVVLI